MTFDLATAAGEFVVVSPAVAQLSGREPESFAAFLQANKQLLDTA